MLISDLHYRWQFPCITEKSAASLHESRAGVALDSLTGDCYLPFAWATLIDLKEKGRFSVDHERSLAEWSSFHKARLGQARLVASTLGKELKVHTVCQHVFWERLLPFWSELGITDVWVSHCEPVQAETFIHGVKVHPWRLFAVNVEDPARRLGLIPGLSFNERPLLASFSGTYFPYYISDARLKLADLHDVDGCEVFFTDSWHFNSIVYGEQIGGAVGSSQSPNLTYEMHTYNQQMSESKFAFCPAGSGPNTLRFWEALALGTVPVLFDRPPALPCLNGVSSDEWESCILRHDPDDLASLPQRLSSITPSEWEYRHRLCLSIFSRIAAATCF